MQRIKFCAMHEKTKADKVQIVIHDTIITLKQKGGLTFIRYQLLGKRTLILFFLFAHAVEQNKNTYT